jgi:hypothetical protein
LSVAVPFGEIKNLFHKLPVRIAHMGNRGRRKRPRRTTDGRILGRFDTEAVQGRRRSILL